MTKTILVPLDLSHIGAQVLETAREMASLHKAKIVLMTVVPILPPIVGAYLPNHYQGDVEDKARERMVTRLREEGLEENGYEYVVRHGVPYDEIIRYAREINAHMIVVGSHAPSAADYLLGSTAAKIVRHAACSVYVVRA